jgi:hypothetical protein
VILLVEFMVLVLCALVGMNASAHSVSLFEANKRGQAAVQIYFAIFSLIVAARWIFS